MDEKPAAAERRPRVDSRADNLFFHGAGDDTASPARPRLDSIPISPLDHAVGAGDNDSAFGAGEFAYSSPVRKQPHNSAAATASTKMTSPQQQLQPTHPFKLMPDAVQRHHLSPLSPSILPHQQETSNFWACDDSTMTTKKQARTLSSPSVSSLILPHRDNAFSAASWWLVDREHEPPLSQGATALAERCLKTFPRWEEPFVRRVLKAYRQYLAMVVATNDWKGSKLFPPPLVRQVWELHRKDIVAYCHDCMILFGGQLVGNNLPDDEHDDNDTSITPQQTQRRDVTLQTLQSQFGKQYDEEIWTYNEVEKNAVNDGSTNGAASHARAAAHGAAGGSGSTSDGSATGSGSSAASSNSSSSSSSSSTGDDVARKTQDTARNQQAPRDPSGRVDTTDTGASCPKEGFLTEETHTLGDVGDKQHDDYTLFPDLAEQAKAESHGLLSNDSNNNENSDEKQRQQEAEYEDEIDDENDNDSEDEEGNDRTHDGHGRQDARIADDNDENETHGRSSSHGAIISICVRTKDDKDSKTWFRVRPDTRMGKVFENLPYIKFGVTTPNTTKFYVQGEEDRPIRPADTVEKLGLWDQDVIILKALAETDDDEVGEEEGDDVRKEEEGSGGGEGEEMEEDAFDGEHGEGDKSNSIGGVEEQALTEQAGLSQPQDGDQTSTPEVEQNPTRAQEEMTSPTGSVVNVKVAEAPEKVAEEEDNNEQEGAGTPASTADEELVLKKMRKSKESVVDSVEYADDENMAKTNLLESKSNLPAPARADEKRALKRKGRSRRSVVESVEYADKDSEEALNLGSEDEPSEPASKRRKKSPKRAPANPRSKRASRRKAKPAYYSPSQV